MTITPDSLLSLEAYAKIRKSSQAGVVAHRRLRTVHLGEHLGIQFEDEATIRRQIQEMLYIEKIFDEDGIRSEIDAYASLVPDGGNWKATMLIEYPDPNGSASSAGLSASRIASSSRSRAMSAPTRSPTRT